MASSSSQKEAHDSLSPMFVSLLRVADTTPENKKLLTKNWWHIITVWYPGLHNTVYCVPPVHFNAVSYKQKAALPKPPEPHERFGYSTLIPTQYSCVRDDEAQQRILHALSAFFRINGRCAFILSNVEFQNYLSKHFLAEDTVLEQVPRVRDADEGEADILVIDKNNGIFVFENKSTGNSIRTPPLTEEAQLAELRGPLQKTCRQLKKNRDVVKRLISDLNQDDKIKISVGILLPNISKELLQKACHQFPLIEEDLQKAVGAFSRKDLLKYCLCSDDLPSANVTGEETISEAILRSVERFFSHLQLTVNPQQMPDDVYEQIVARFCGPLTTVKIYTEKSMPRVKLNTVYSKQRRRRSKHPKAEKVKVVPFESRTVAGSARETARRFSELVLLQEQIELLQRPEDFVHIEGPPGTGKTLMLLLRILTWLEGENMVWLISLSPSSRSVTHVLYEQVMMTLRAHKGEMEAEAISKEKLRLFIMTRPENTLDDKYFERKLHKWRLRAKLKDSAENWAYPRPSTLPPARILQDKRVCLALDETAVSGKGLEGFFNQVLKCQKEGCFTSGDFTAGLSVWSASVERCGRPLYARDPLRQDKGSDQFGILWKLHMPLRCPPSIQRALMLVQPSVDQDVCVFQEEYLRPHPACSTLNTSTEGRIPYHADGMPVHLIAHGGHTMSDRLGIWECGQCGAKLADYLKRVLGIGGGKEPIVSDVPLTYRDAMIVTTQAAPLHSVPVGEFMSSLAKKEIALAVNKTEDQRDSSIPSDDVILVTDFNSIHGLERAVIIVIPDLDQHANKDFSSDIMDTDFCPSTSVNEERPRLMGSTQRETVTGAAPKQWGNMTLDKGSTRATHSMTEGLEEPMEEEEPSGAYEILEAVHLAVPAIEAHADPMETEVVQASTPGLSTSTNAESTEDLDLECDGEQDDNTAHNFECMNRQEPRRTENNGIVETPDPFTYSGSFSQRQLKAALDTLSETARRDIFYIGSRAVCQLIIFHFGKDPE